MRAELRLLLKLVWRAALTVIPLDMN
jgi:hypothetical protein